ncbi:MAG: MarR family transcriptional regulator [Gemmatimonadetes bacterium]|nr:MarR family transcriptional regulator [Gemmatimonadota bacterium]
MPDQELALKLFIVLSRARNAVADHVDAHTEACGVTTGEFAVMEALFHKGPLLLGEVKRKILVSSGGVTYLIDRLEARGLVERRACPTDRRARYAALTQAGQDLMARIFPEHAGRIVAALGGLNDEEKGRAIELLRTLGLHAEGLAGGARVGAE